MKSHARLRSMLIAGALLFFVANFRESLPAKSETVEGQRFAQNTAVSFNVASINGRPGQTIPMNIAVVGGTGSLRGLVMIRGIPSQLKVSSGFLNGAAWMVSLAELKNLQLVVPHDFQGRFDIEVIFVSGESKERQTRFTSVSIQPETQPQDHIRAVHSAAALPQEKPSAPSGLSPELEKTLMNRAAGLLKNGDVGAARVVYKHLASNGSALGALSLARTYDPAVLSTLNVVGMQPDPALAEQWYKRAAELGDASAVLLLEALAPSNR